MSSVFDPPPSVPEIDARLAESEARMPFPEGERRRMEARRHVLRHVPQGGVGAEIGVFRGHFAEILATVARPRKLYLVDPWTLLGETFGWGRAYTLDDTLPTAVARRDAELRAAKFPDIETVIVEGVYPTCREAIVDRLDWAYLDAGHGYDETLWQLEHLAEQVADDGLILGDDWQTDPGHMHHGVYRAVQRFVRTRDWEIVVAGQANQWCIRRRGPD